MVELALVLPVLLLLVLVAIDFGRVYLGYVNLQQMARIAGGFAAAHASAWDTPGSTATQTEYQNLVANDAAAINCRDVNVFKPAFPEGFDIGDPVQISISCNFDILTPIISTLIGGTIPVSASTTYPVKEGAVAEVPGGGGPIVLAPVADFVGTPVSGYGDTAAGYGTLDVVFTDLSENAPTDWEWNFGDGSGLVSTKGPHTIHYECTKLPGETCTYTVTLKVGNAGGIDTAAKTDYITVTVPPATGPVAEFTGTPTSGTNPLTVAFSFVEKRSPALSYSAYDWDFGDGQTGTGANVSHVYSNPGSYDVRLTVTEVGGATNSQTKVNYILVARKICTVPDFIGTKKNNAQVMWNAAGFTTTVLYNGAANGNWTIRKQSWTGGLIDPQPDGCNSVITVFDKP